MVDPRRYSTDALQRALGEQADNMRTSGGGGNSGIGLVVLLVSLAGVYNIASENTSLNGSYSEKDKRYPSITIGVRNDGYTEVSTHPNERRTLDSACKIQNPSCQIGAHIKAGAPACITYTHVNYQMSASSNLSKTYFKALITQKRPTIEEKKSVCDGIFTLYRGTCSYKTSVVCNFN